MERYCEVVACGFVCLCVLGGGIVCGVCICRMNRIVLFHVIIRIVLLSQYHFPSLSRFHFTRLPFATNTPIPTPTTPNHHNHNHTPHLKQMTHTAVYERTVLNKPVELLDPLHQTQRKTMIHLPLKQHIDNNIKEHREARVRKQQHVEGHRVRHEMPHVRPLPLNHLRIHPHSSTPRSQSC